MKKLLLIFFVLFNVQTFAKSDSISLQTNETVQNLKTENQCLKIKLEDLNEKYDKRFSDFMIWMGLFTTIFIGVLIANWFSTKNTAEREARKEAREAFKEEQNKFQKEFEAIKLYKG
jgi:hypothetical protein